MFTFEGQPLANDLPDVADARAQPMASLSIYCLGPFQVCRDDGLVAHWPSGKGKSIFKYLVTQRRRPVHKERLMEMFWPNTDADAARRNLNVAIHSARQALRCDVLPCPIVFQEDCYQLNPCIDTWVDFELFLQHVANAQSHDARGSATAAIEELVAAERLYQGDFLEEHRYDEWLVPLRASLCEHYCNLLERLSGHAFETGNYDGCIVLCAKMLVLDRCDERAHRRLMHCYGRQGIAHLALRQFHACARALRTELDTEPSESTRALFQQVKQRRAI